MALVKVTIELEYEALNIDSARLSLMRISGELRHIFENDDAFRGLTGVKKDTVKIDMTRKTIDGKRLP